MIRVDAARLQLRGPGGQWVQLAHQAASRDSAALPIGAVTVSWGRATPRDHPEPGTTQLAIRVPMTDQATPQLLAFDTEVKLLAQLSESSPSGWQAVAAGGWVTIARGWVTSWDRTAADDHWLYVVTVADALARAAGVMLADTPWPNNQVREARLQRINTISPVGPVVVDTGLGFNKGLGPRDVDNYAALEALQRCATLGENLIETDSGLLALVRVMQSIPRYNTLGNRYLRLTDPAPVVEVPAAMVEDAGRRMDRSHTLNQASAEVHNNTELKTVSYRAPRTTAPARWAIATDTQHATSQVAAWLQAVVDRSLEAEAVVQPLLKPGRLLIEAEGLHAPGLWRLLDINQRHTVFLSIQQAPADVDAVQFVTSAQLTIEGARVQLEVSLMPARLYGIRPLRFADLPRNAQRPQLHQPPDQRVRFSQLAAINFAPAPTN